MKIKLKGIKLKNLKRLRKTKTEKEQELKTEYVKTEEEPITEVKEEIPEELEEETVKEYRETFYSVGQEPKSSSKEKKPLSFKYRKDFSSIEENIDDIGKEKKLKDSSDVNKKVDLILSKKKK